MAVLLLPIRGAVFGSVAADFLAGAISTQGTEQRALPYRYLVPPGYDPANRYPLIVFLHGTGEEGNDNAAQLTHNANGALQLVSGSNQQQFPAFMLAPQANTADGWNVVTLGQTVRAIRELESRFSIDHDRLYVTGLSRGGQGTYSIGSWYPDVFAALVPLSGWLETNPASLAGTPIWAFHAADDSTVPIGYGDDAVIRVRRAGGRVTYTRYATGGHPIWPAAYGNPYLLPWMMAQRRHQPASGTPFVQIIQPASGTTAPQVPFNVAGQADIPQGPFSVHWTFSPSDSTTLIDPQSLPSTTGTTDWSISAATPTSASYFLTVLARGPSWAEGTGSFTGGGFTTTNDTVWVIPAGADMTSPTLNLSAPSTNGAWTTTGHTVNLAGMASAHAGKQIATVSWSDDHGDEGVASFFPSDGSWTINDITLPDGDTTITVVARDDQSVPAQTRLSIHAGTSPVITRQPDNAFVALGKAAHFRVVAGTATNLSYQWSKDGVPLAGATEAILTIPSAAAIDSGAYTVAVTGPSGVTTSDAALLTVSSTARRGRLVNLSARAVAGSGDATLIVGFVVAGEGNLPVLLRGVGATLRSAPFNINDAVADPSLRLFHGSALSGENDNGSDDPDLIATARRVGAFPLVAGSKDAALTATCSSGANTIHITSGTGDLGVALAEAYDVSGSSGDAEPRLANLSARAQIHGGNQVLIAGFVISGPGAVTVLIRGVGPTLQQSHVDGVLAEPQLELHSGADLLLENHDWSDTAASEEIVQANNRTGSPLPAGSKDAAILVTLPAGVYTAIVRSKNGTTGVALLEVYEMP